MVALLLIPVTAFGLLLQRPPPLGALRPEPRAALPRSVPHMIAPVDSSYPLRGTPLDDQVSPVSKFGTLLATNAIATVSPLASVFIGLVLLSRGKVEPDDDANELVGTVGTILRKLIKPTGSTNWRQMGYTTCPSYDYTKNYPWDDRGSVDVSGCPKIFDGELNDLTMGYVFSAGKILRVILRASPPHMHMCVCTCTCTCAMCPHNALTPSFRPTCALAAPSLHTLRRCTRATGAIEIVIELLTGSQRGKSMFDAAYGSIISEPAAVKRGISDDAGFAQQFLSGTNPLMIKRVTDIGEV